MEKTRTNYFLTLVRDGRIVRYRTYKDVPLNSEKWDVKRTFAQEFRSIEEARDAGYKELEALQFFHPCIMCIYSAVSDYFDKTSICMKSVGVSVPLKPIAEYRDADFINQDVRDPVVFANRIREIDDTLIKERGLGVKLSLIQRIKKLFEFR